MESKETARSPSPRRDDVGAGEGVADTGARPGGDVTVDEMSEWSFPASDPPSTWTWDVAEAAKTRARSGGDDSQR